ncbi:MAG: AmmeMemoRadiSam system protein B [Candidatus Micrarchaeia archaeon]
MESRKPAFNGSFYPASRRECEAALEKFRRDAGKQKTRSRAVVAPHAGWVYSGAMAMRSFLALAPAKTVVVLAPNHTGLGSPVSTSARDWLTPLGECKIDSALVQALAPAVRVDEAAHSREHSVEVQLPFIQFLHGTARFAPVVFLDQSLRAAFAVAEALADAPVSIVASSDFTHYEEAAKARSVDEKLFSFLADLDAEGFHRAALRSSACGYAPVACAARWAELNGAKRGELLAFSNSGEATGDYSSVVDYASLAFV